MYVLIPVYYAASCGEYNPKRDLMKNIFNKIQGFLYKN